MTWIAVNGDILMEERSIMSVTLKDVIIKHPEEMISSLISMVTKASNPILAVTAN